MATATAVAPRPRSTTKIVLFAVFAALTLFVTYGKNREVLNPASEMARHYAPAMGVLVLHGVFAVLAMALGVFQFSNRLRARHLQLHRALGYVYVVAVFVGAPLGTVVAARIDGMSVTAASVVQTLGWVVCTAIALYCVRNGNIAEHRRWMLRGYPFAMVFTFARAIIPLPPVAAAGIAGRDTVVWTLIALAAFVPSIFLEWGAITRPRKAA